MPASTGTSSVAFFGGSFNPPHLGHVLAAAYARGCGFDRVLVAPVKAHAFGKHLAPFEQRVAMARLAFCVVDGVEVSDVEKALPEPNYTLMTLQTLSRRHPDWSLRLLVGSDVVRDAPRWFRFEEIQRLAPPFVLERSTRSSDAPGGGGEGFVFPNVSSTKIRHALARRRDDAALREWLNGVVPRAVLSHVERERLYLDGDGSGAEASSGR